MERNKKLLSTKGFKHLKVFKSQVSSLIKLVYPQEEITEYTILFKSKERNGISAIVHPYHIYIDVSEAYVNATPILKKEYKHTLTAINTSFDYRPSSKRVYLYPLDRDEFPDTPLGMEQRAAFFIVVLEVCLKHLVNLKS